MPFKTACLIIGLPKFLWETAVFVFLEESTGSMQERYLA